MSTIIVRARYIGATDTRSSRVSVRSEDSHEILPINYGWRTDNIYKEAIAECWGVPTDAVQHSMDLAGWRLYIVDTSVMR